MPSDFWRGAEEMIARVWKGWTKAEDADAYERLLRKVVYPGIQTIEGYLGGYLKKKFILDG